MGTRETFSSSHCRRICSRGSIQRARGYRGMWKRVPIGPCSFISPFDFPLNLTAYKVAPKLAVGWPFVL